jgi:hypothetical protein
LNTLPAQYCFSPKNLYFKNEISSYENPATNDYYPVFITQKLEKVETKLQKVAEGFVLAPKVILKQIKTGLKKGLQPGCQKICQEFKTNN